jgi:thiol:disulfide interchange protein DsbA
MKKIWLALSIALTLLPIAASADTTNFVQGVNYLPVDPAHKTDVKPGQVEVIEFYWYGCPHCFALEPFVQAWEQHLPKDVVFKRIPASTKGSEFYMDAQATFTAEQLGIGDKIREPFFNAIHRDDDEALRSDQDAIRTFFGKFGVKPADFDTAWNSFGVQMDLSRAQRLADSYQLEGVPTIIINGKWKTGAGYQMEPADIMRCVEFLIAKEEAAMKPAPKAAHK